MALKVNTLMPSLEGVSLWLNGEVSNDELQGHPTLIHFWAVSCPACMHNMTSVAGWGKRYEAQGLRIVAVHLPRVPDDYDTQQVRLIAENLGISWPCAVDNDSILGGRFDTGTIWPYYFLFDGEGKMRSRAAGGVGLNLLENALHRLNSLVK